MTLNKIRTWFIRIENWTRFYILSCEKYLYFVTFLFPFIYIYIYVYFVICLIVYFNINNIFIEISCFVVPFIDNLICFLLTTGIKRWIRKCRQSVNYWDPTKVKSWCGADTEMQGDSTSDQYGCLIGSRHRSDIELCCTSDVGPTWKPMSARCRKVYRPDIGPI